MKTTQVLCNTASLVSSKTEYWSACILIRYLVRKNKKRQIKLIIKADLIILKYCLVKSLMIFFLLEEHGFSFIFRLLQIKMKGNFYDAHRHHWVQSRSMIDLIINEKFQFLAVYIAEQTLWASFFVSPLRSKAHFFLGQVESEETYGSYRY